MLLFGIYVAVEKAVVHLLHKIHRDVGTLLLCILLLNAHKWRQVMYQLFVLIQRPSQQIFERLQAATTSQLQYCCLR